MMLTTITKAIAGRLGLGSRVPTIPASWPMTWWQDGLDLAVPRADPMACSAVRACVDLISTTIATMPMRHMRRLENGTEIEVQGGIQRLLDNPVRDVLSGLDFTDLLTTHLLEHGNAFAFVTRDDVGRALELHPLPARAVRPIVSDDGSVYYEISETFFDGAEGIGGEPGIVLRAADVLHIRIGTSRHPLIGTSPLDACRAAVDLDGVIKRHEVSFHLNSARPSGAITTEERLTAEQTARLKEMFRSIASATAQGSPVILPAGAKFQPFAVNAHDAETVALLRMTVTDVARAFRVPPPLLGELSEASFSNVAELNRHFVASLRFYTRAISTSLARVLRLPPGDHIVFDEEAALQPPSEKERLAALAEGVRGGVYTPNEARRRVGLPPVEGGNAVFMQRQNAPIGQLATSPAWASEVPSAPPAELESEPQPEEGAAP